MQPAVDVGVFLRIGLLDAVEDGARLLRGGRIVEIDQRLAIDLLRQDREIRPRLLDVVCAVGRHQTLSASMPSRWRTRASSAATIALVADQLDRVGEEGKHQDALRFRLLDAARAQEEEHLLVDLPAGRAVAADHVVGEDFELRLVGELRALGEKQRPAHHLGIGLLRAGLDDDLALEDALRLVVHRRLEIFLSAAIGPRRG